MYSPASQASPFFFLITISLFSNFFVKKLQGVFEEVGVHHFDDEDEKGHDYDRPKPCTIL